MSPVTHFCTILIGGWMDERIERMEKIKNAMKWDLIQLVGSAIV